VGRIDEILLSNKIMFDGRSIELTFEMSVLTLKVGG